MAYGCGYAGGYGSCDSELFPVCGGGYAGFQFGAITYGGDVFCNAQTVEVSQGTGIQSNVEEFCILDFICTL